MVIRYEGPRANGMPEMYFAAAILAADRALSTTTAIVTDGRYSGTMEGPCIGHVAPEVIEGGPIALVAENCLIEINVPERRLAIVGIQGELKEGWIAGAGLDDIAGERGPVCDAGCRRGKNVMTIMKAAVVPSRIPARVVFGF